MKALIRVLQQGRIWAVNLGEMSNITPDDWTLFTSQITETNLCFFYASDHLLSTGEKQRIQKLLETNRKRLSYPKPLWLRSRIARKVSFFRSMKLTRNRSFILVKVQRQF